MTTLQLYPSNDGIFIRGDPQVAERQCQQIGPSDLGSGVCQECGSDFGMHAVRRENLITIALGPREIPYRYHTDPANADFVWMECAACYVNLDGFHAMSDDEYLAWLYGHPSVWDDRPRRIL